MTVPIQKCITSAKMRNISSYHFCCHFDNITITLQAGSKPLSGSLVTAFNSKYTFFYYQLIICRSWHCNQGIGNVCHGYSNIITDTKGSYHVKYSNEYVITEIILWPLPLPGAMPIPLNKASFSPKKYWYFFFFFDFSMKTYAEVFIRSICFGREIKKNIYQILPLIQRYVCLMLHDWAKACWEE